jgi:lysophospholipase L1-like esterase
LHAAARLAYRLLVRRSILGFLCGHNDPESFIEEFKKRQPQARVLILGIFPRTTAGTDPIRATIKEINTRLAKFADNKQVFYMDIGDKLLVADGTLTAEIMSDGLHPTTKGYQSWADATLPRVKELMGVK